MEARLQELEAELAKTKKECEELRGNVRDRDHQSESRSAPRAVSMSSPNSALDWASRGENTKTYQVDGGGFDDPIVREVGRMVNDPDGIGRFMGSSSGIFLLGTAFGSYQASVKSRSEDMKPRLDDLFILDASRRRHDLFAPTLLNPVTELPERSLSESLVDSFF